MSAPLSSPDVTRRGRLGSYGLWQLRDYLVDRGAPTVMVVMLFGYLAVAPKLPGLARNMNTISPGLIKHWGSADAARAVVMRDFNEGFLRSFLGVIVFLGALFAMNGIVANDRKQGFYRFLFSKPISPSRYYGQAFVIHWAGFLIVAVAMALIYGALISPILSVLLIQTLALMFLMYAGIAFLLSSAARWDWLSLVSVTVAANYLWASYGESTSLLATLLYVLPPLHRTEEIYMAAARGETMPWALSGWCAGYGLVAYLLGLVVLRYRRLAIV